MLTDIVTQSIMMAYDPSGDSTDETDGILGDDLLGMNEGEESEEEGEETE